MKARLRRALKALYAMWREDNNTNAYLAFNTLYTPYAAFKEVAAQSYLLDVSDEELAELSNKLCTVFQRALSQLEPGEKTDPRELLELASLSIMLTNNLLDLLEQLEDEEEE